MSAIDKNIKVLFQHALKKHQAGEIDIASRAYKDILGKQPKHADSLHLLGVVCLQKGDLLPAENWIRTALEINPNAAPYWNNLGEVLRKLKRMDEARACFNKALAITPSYADAHNNLGNVCSEEGDYAGAVKCYEEAVSHGPQQARSWYNLGSAYRHLKQFEEGISALLKATELVPTYADAWNNLGLIYSDIEDEKRAEEALRKALEADPENPEAKANLGHLLMRRHEMDSALPMLADAFKLRPGNELLRLTLAMLYATIGETELASELLAKLSLEGLAAEPASNALFFWNYDPSLTPAELLVRYKEWGKKFANPANALPSINQRARDSRLRIGYVSADFNNHAVRNFLLPLLQKHNRKEFQIIAYSNSSANDESTKEYQQVVEVWRDISHVADKEAALLIRRDQVDVLVDLAGHTRGNRLSMFSYRAAPVQASWLGYGCTTGVSAVDYFIGDNKLTPPGSEVGFAETLVRLDRPSLVYTPSAKYTVGDLPCLKNNCITFGSLTRVIRINSHLLDVWSQILKEVKGSRLLLNQPVFANKIARETIWQKLEARGISRKRVLLQNRSPHWLSYVEDIDIALDPFPHNAGTTTFEALWMGVPVVSVRSRPSMGRYGDMILSAIGHSEWVANTVEEYKSIAIRLAENKKILAGIREALRSEMERSSLMDAEGFCRSMEKIYQDLSRRKWDVMTQESKKILTKSDALTAEQYVEQLEKLVRVRQGVEAETIAKAFIKDFHSDARGYMGLGLALRQQRRDEEGIKAYEQAISIDPALFAARINLGRALAQTGKITEAVEVLREAVRMQPESAAALSLLSWALRLNDKFEDAIAAAREAISLEPKKTDAWQNLGNALRAAGKTTEAAEAYRHIIGLDPNDLDARTCLGSIIKDRALYPEAREIYEEGLRRSATSDDAIWTNYFFALNYDPFLSSQEIYQRYFDWGQRTLANIHPSPEFVRIDKNPLRKLRIGLVSADFARHAIRFFVYPWLEHVDRVNYHWTLYSNTIKEDQETAKFRRLADTWRDIRWKPDRDIVELIRQDQIDILIDLSGHTAGHKLLVFAAKPAPVQMAMLGTGYTTGLSTIDYFLANERFVPAESAVFLAEKIARLPVPPFVFQPEYPALPVMAAPARRNGYVTFGCMSRMVRLNRVVISAWIEILRRLPTSRLRLDHPQVAESDVAELLQQQFRQGGIDLARIDILSTVPHWPGYDEIDIALDPFPHNAGTTTLEALWKGVPVLSLSGRPPLGRFGDTILNAVGLSEWITSDVKLYINKAVEFGSDIEKLAGLRSILRRRVELSPLMDGAGFALYLQEAFRNAWESYCNDGPVKELTIAPIERESGWVNCRLAVGTKHLKNNQLAEARYYFELILKSNPNESKVWLNQGATFLYEGRDQDALSCFKKAVSVDIGYRDGWFNLGVTEQGLKHFGEAEQAYLKVLALDDEHDGAWNNLGVIYKDAQRSNEALKCFRKALEFRSEKPSYLDNLGALLERGDRLFEAKRLLERCLELDPNYLPAVANLGNVYRKLAMLDEAMMMQRKLSDTTPINHPLLFTANYHPDLTAQELYTVYRDVCSKLNATPPSVRPRQVNKERLRVGFVGGDFRNHAASKFLLPLFRNMHSERIRFVIFANQANSDAISEKYKKCAQWVDVYEMDDSQFVACVQKENIDILIDVAGWTINSRLVAMASKPAPVQVTWLGYGYTTGLKAIDWFLGSPRFTPPGSEAFFSERIFNLPRVAFCFDPLGDLPDVNKLPALERNGGVTFGCLSRTVRLNYRVIRLWARILLKIPNSRLIIDNKPFEDAEVCTHFHKLFQEHQIENDRVILRNSTPHWRAYQDIDIALDPFPHNAGTTTIEALAMGVPSISLRERPPLGRYGDMILGSVGLGAWVVDSEQAYLDCALRWAESLEDLAKLRNELRDRLFKSPLCDFPKFANEFEEAMFSIWKL